METFTLTKCIIFVSLILHITATIPTPPRIVKQPPPDELLFQVAQQPNENDKPFIIECEAEAVPAPKYRWVKDGRHFDWQAHNGRVSQQPGRGTLVITAPRDEDFGRYQCFAENALGTATSNAVSVRQAILGSFEDAPPVWVTAPEGAPLKLACRPPDGWPKPSVYWLIQTVEGGIKSINSTRMTLDPEGNLWFSNVTRRDASVDFAYTCAAVSVFRNEYKLGNRVLLNVTAPAPAPAPASAPAPAPVQQYVSPTNEVVLRGGEIELYCIFGGTPVPETVWTKSGRQVVFSDRVRERNYGKTLLIKRAQYEDEGTYTCEASNGVGQAKSHSIDLQVLAAPYFTQAPEVQFAAEGETVELRCVAAGEPEPWINWVHNGKPIGESTPNARLTVTPNKVVIEAVDRTDTGNYGCNATNALGYVYKDVFVNVLAFAPEITEQLTHMACVDRDTVTLPCAVLGAPTPLVKWLRNATELSGGRYSTLRSGGLQIRDVEFGDAGEYRCYAENKLGSAEAVVTLEVKEHTRITHAPEDAEVQAGTTVAFRCNVVGDASLALGVVWFHDGVEIDVESEQRLVQGSDNALTVTMATERDSGTYTCVAETDLDQAHAQATLTVLAAVSV